MHFLCVFIVDAMGGRRLSAWVIVDRKRRGWEEHGRPFQRTKEEEDEGKGTIHAAMRGPSFSFSF